MNLKMLGLAIGAAMALMSFAATSASATTLELSGVTQNKAVAFSASIAAGNTTVLSRTDGAIANTCATSSMAGTTTVFTGTFVTGALATLTFSNCTFEKVVVHKAGQLYIEHETGTTAGNVYSENAEVTFPTAFGFTVTCVTGAGTKIGTLKGVAAGTQVMEINAVLNCGFLLPTASWTGKYTITTTGLGVSA